MLIDNLTWCFCSPGVSLIYMYIDLLGNFKDFNFSYENILCMATLLFHNSFLFGNIFEYGSFMENS